MPLRKETKSHTMITLVTLNNPCFWHIRRKNKCNLIQCPFFCIGWPSPHAVPSSEQVTTSNPPIESPDILTGTAVRRHHASIDPRIVASNAHHYVALVPVVNAMLYALSVRTQSYNLPTVSSEDGPLRRNQYPKGSNMSVARAFCLWLRLIM